MGYKEAAEIIRVLDGLVREWAEKGELSALEQDLMLDKTKKLYETVRFAAKPTAAGNDGLENVAAPLCGEPRGAASEPDGRENVAAEHFVREVPVQAAEPRGPEFAGAEKPVAADPGGQENAAAPLYGERQVAALASAEKGTAAGCGTIADALASAMPHGEYSCGDRVTSLNGALGLNDRYQICRDLFDGDMEACRSAIDKLDLYDNIEDAMICIQDSYNWPIDSAAAQLVASLLERKFL